MPGADVAKLRDHAVQIAAELGGVAQITLALFSGTDEWDASVQADVDRGDVVAVPAEQLVR